ncbi:MAG: MaoC family dehydratase N-terminal domain-containing protein [Betaproteobacteria bacterium]
MTETAWRAWVGRTESRTDVVSPTPVAALAATLDRDDPPPAAGDALPPLWHWLYFLPLHRQSSLGPDGHAQRGGFLPPVPLPRRMWAGSRLQFLEPIRISDRIERESTIDDVTTKQGRSGTLVFVRVRHAIEGPRGPCVREEHDIVFREHPRDDARAAAPAQSPTDAEWQRTITPDDVLLFRYSALTFNGHRIHYDRRYVTAVEGYPGLVVHGPLIATLLLELVHRERPQAVVSGFSFRAVSPLFDIASFTVNGRRALDGRSAHLWASRADGALAMDATVTFG